MRRKNPQLDAVKAELAEAGIIPQITNGGKHIQVSWEGPGGEPRQMTVAGTPSDRRGPANARAVARRMLRQDDAKHKPQGSKQ